MNVIMNRLAWEILSQFTVRDVVDVASRSPAFWTVKLSNDQELRGAEGTRLHCLILASAGQWDRLKYHAERAVEVVNISWSFIDHPISNPPVQCECN